MQGFVFFFSVFVLIDTIQYCSFSCVTSFVYLYLPFVYFCIKVYILLPTFAAPPPHKKGLDMKGNEANGYSQTKNPAPLITFPSGVVPNPVVAPAKSDYSQQLDN